MALGARASARSQQRGQGRYEKPKRTPRGIAKAKTRPPRLSGTVNITSAMTLSAHKLNSMVIYILQKESDIVFLQGAGVSASAGIPTFRGSSSWYKSYSDGTKVDPEDLFHPRVFTTGESTKRYLRMIRDMRQTAEHATPTYFHTMEAAISRRILRVYTQNVDGLENRLLDLGTNKPLSQNPDKTWPKTIQLHGDLETMICSKYPVCSYRERFQYQYFQEATPCPGCLKSDEKRVEMGKRPYGTGFIRSGVTLYEEHNVDHSKQNVVIAHDSRRLQHLFVVGTSLKTRSIQSLVEDLSYRARKRQGYVIWINVEPPLEAIKHLFDIIVIGTADDVALSVALGWDRKRFLL